jgi:hypothetical protein
VWCQKAIFLLSTKLLSCSLFTLPKLQILWMLQIHTF